MCVKKKDIKYNFSWIEEIIKKWQPEFRKKENIRRSISMIPFLLNHWIDLEHSYIKTHLGENIDDIDEYFRLKR